MISLCRHFCLPLAPLLSALDRACKPAARWGPSFGGALPSPAAISIDQDAERSLPPNDGYALLPCPTAPLSIPAIASFTQFVLPLPLMRPRACWYSAVVRTPRRSPTADVAVPPASAPLPPPPASSRFSLLARRSSAHTFLNRCLVRADPGCSAHNSPASCGEIRLPL